METDNMQLKKGDIFIRHSKYGHVFGEVKEITSHKIQSVDYGCSILEVNVISTNNVAYNINECQKVLKIFSQGEIEQLKELKSRLVEAKSMAELKMNMEINKQIRKI